MIKPGERVMPPNVRPLGTVAKSAPKGARAPDTDTAPGRGVAGERWRADAVKWQLQRAAQGLLSDRKGAITAAGDAIQVPVYRVATCHRWSHGPGPALWRSPEGTNAEYADVHTCGSVWHCPICAAKITSSRREELNAAIAAWRDRGGEVYLCTRTFSHDKHGRELSRAADDAGNGAGLLQLMSKALSRAKGTRRARELAERAGVVGAIRSLEVTHGEINGWHPHTHELLFGRPGARGALLSHRVEWIRRLIKLGLAGMRAGMTRAERAEQLRYLRRHAYTVQLGDKAADYVAKFGMEPSTDGGGRWGPASELTRGHVKVGQRLTGRTPFTLLRQYIEGDKRAGHLFREFAIAFQGRAQLYWSPGLRAALVELCQRTSDEIYFKVGATADQLAWAARARYLARDLSDDDIAMTRNPKCTEFVVRLSTEEWRVVLRTNQRHELLIAAQFGGAAEVRELLLRLRAERPTHGDVFVADWRRSDGGRPVSFDRNGAVRC